MNIWRTCRKRGLRQLFVPHPGLCRQGFNSIANQSALKMYDVRSCVTFFHSVVRHLAANHVAGGGDLQPLFGLDHPFFRKIKIRDGDGLQPREPNPASTLCAVMIFGDRFKCSSNRFSEDRPHLLPLSCGNVFGQNVVIVGQH